MSLRYKNLAMASATGGSRMVEGLRGFGVVLICALPLALAWGSFRALLQLISDNDTFSQIPLIPLVSLFLIYAERTRSFHSVSFGWRLGAIFIVPGLLAVGMAEQNFWHLDVINQCCLFVFGTVLTWIGAFGLFWGPVSFRKLLFPLLFLFFMVPIPEPLLSKTLYALQVRSADAAEWFFRLAGIPYLRRSLVFVLPGFSIRVAEECSGIRSSLALLITTVLAAHLFLKSVWKKLVLCLVVVPLAILKNGLRIMTLSALSIYVDPGFLYGNLHRRGGIVFFALALVPMGILLKVLSKREISNATTPIGSGA
jgi:exosortase